MCPRSTGLSLALLVSAVAGCASPRPVTTARTVQLASDRVEDTCPLRVPGTSVTSESIDGGTAYVFTTTGDAAEVRRRVRTLVRLHDLRVLTPGEPTLTAATDDVPSGARLNIRPVDADVTVHGDAARLVRSGCPAIPAAAMVAWLSHPDDGRSAAITSR